MYMPKHTRISAHRRKDTVISLLNWQLWYTYLQIMVEWGWPSWDSTANCSLSGKYTALSASSSHKTAKLMVCCHNSIVQEDRVTSAFSQWKTTLFLMQLHSSILWSSLVLIYQILTLSAELGACHDQYTILQAISHTGCPRQARLRQN